MLDYNPLIQPFELPVQKLVAHCISEAPLFFPPSEGAKELESTEPVDVFTLELIL